MRIVLIAITLASLFIWITGSQLPDNIASHFDAAGVANGFTQRTSYLIVMISIVMLVPLSIALLSRWITTLPDELVNLPNKAYWLAPERRTTSLGYIANWLEWFSISIAGFLCYVHWLVVQANEHTPPHLNTTLLYIGLVVVFITLTLGIVALLARFRRVD